MNSLLRPGRMVLTVGIVAVLIVAALSAASWFWISAHPAATSAITAPAPMPMLSEPIPDGPEAELLRRGRYLTSVADCVSCHTSAIGKPFAGGLGLQTPFGTIFSPNITGDAETGIGRWTNDQFYRAMTEGVAPGWKHLYPAFPYNYFNIVAREDSDAILAYLKSLPPVRYEPPANQLPFPLNIRATVIGWNMLFLRDRKESPPPDASPEWVRGSYLVNGLGHCGACHTPKNALGSDRGGEFLHGGNLESWTAPDLTSNARTGLGRWSVDEIAEYLKTGRNAHSNAAGPMAEVVSFSTSLMNDADLRAMAVYLKSVPASPDRVGDAPSQEAMRRGGAIYVDACSACHLSNGRGEPRYFPPLAGSASAQQADPTGVVRTILAGARTGPTHARPTPLAMPSFAWKLDDRQIADVATFVRNSWGNSAPAVQADSVEDMRKTLKLQPPIGSP